MRRFTFIISLSLLCMHSALQAQLDPKLTPAGAIKQGNADGSIPSWTGKYVGNLPNLPSKPGEVLPNPYANEKPKTIITNKNVAEYQSLLSDGVKALFDRFKTFEVHVYPTHRDFGYSDEFYARTEWNLSNTVLNGTDDISKFTGGIPFAKPATGAQIIWNARVGRPIKVFDGTSDQVAVYPNGNSERYRNRLMGELPIATQKDIPVGFDITSLGEANQQILIYYEVIEPARKKGERAVIHEPLNEAKYDRKVWVYVPSLKRVKRAPEAAYDTPVGPGGLLTADDNVGFNGALDRYNWTIVGKQEMIVPFHNYGFDDPKLTQEDLLLKTHVNPKHLRFEQRRVWVVEATLKPGKRHVYAKRRFYVEEDSWTIVAVERYDGRNQLWRIGLQTSVYNYFIKAYTPRVFISYDLDAGAYIASGLVNQTKPTNYDVEPRGAAFYTSTHLRKRGIK